MKKALEDILLTSDVYDSIKQNEDVIFNIIPELKDEVGFDQKNKYHCYDVWEHTLHVISNSNNDLIIRLTLLLHDIGKPYCYQEISGIRHFKNHANVSSSLALSILKRLGYSNDVIESVCFLISNHATTITEDVLNDTNIEMYKKLIHVQYCDASGYTKKYADLTKTRLDSVNDMINSYGKVR